MKIISGSTLLLIITLGLAGCDQKTPAFLLVDPKTHQQFSCVDQIYADFYECNPITDVPHNKP